MHTASFPDSDYPPNMGLNYQLVNLDKLETLSFSRVNTGLKIRELSGTVVSGNLVTYYLLKNRGDRIAFIDDHTPIVDLFGQSYPQAHFWEYLDITQALIAELIQLEILRDDGVIWIDEQEDLFLRDLKNAWDPQCTPTASDGA